MNRTIVRTSILGQIESLYYYLANKSDEQMGLIWGNPGIGKTTSCRYLAEKHKLLYLSCLPSQTPSSLTNSLLELATGERRRSLTGATSALLKYLKVHHTGIIFDEAERLVNRNNLLETVRTIHDNSSVPILLVGMNAIYSRLSSSDYFFDRCAGFVSAPLPDFDDAKALAKTVGRGQFSDNLIHALLRDKEVGHNLRRIRNALAFIEENSGFEARGVIDLKDWGEKSFTHDFSKRPTMTSNVVLGVF